MKAQQSFESESGARFSVGVGCPSFGGQRTDDGGSSRPRASLGTGLKPSLSGSRLVGLGQAQSSAVLCENLYTVTVVPLVQRGGFISSRRTPLTPNAKCQQSPHVSVVPIGHQVNCLRRWRSCVPGVPLLSRGCLTAQSRGRLAASRKPPLTSDVRCGSEARGRRHHVWHRRSSSYVASSSLVLRR